MRTIATVDKYLTSSDASEVSAIRAVFGLEGLSDPKDFASAIEVSYTPLLPLSILCLQRR